MDDTVEHNPFQNLKVRIFLLFLAFLLAMQTFLGKLGLISPSVAILGDLLLSLWIFVWIRLTFARWGGNIKRLIGTIPNDYEWRSAFGVVTMLLLFSYGSGCTLLYFLSFLLPPSLELDPYMVNFYWNFVPGSSIVSMVLEVFLFVIGPFVEELLCRGILIHRWKLKLGIKRAVFASSVLFAVFHFNLAIIQYFIFGFVMAVLYIKTRTLLIPTFCHFLYNFLGSFFTFLWVELRTGGGAYTAADFRSDVWVGLIALLLSTPWMIDFIKKNWPNREWNLPYFMNTA